MWLWKNVSTNVCISKIFIYFHRDINFLIFQHKYFDRAKSIGLEQDCTSAQWFASIGNIIAVLVIVASFYSQSVGYSFREKSINIFHEVIIHIIREDPRERNAYICAFFCQYKECDFKGVPIDAGVRVVNGIDIIVWDKTKKKWVLNLFTRGSKERGILRISIVQCCV